MARTIERARLGNLLFTAGFAFVAISSSFSITLTEGGILLAWIGFFLAMGRSKASCRWMFLDYLLIIFLVWEFAAALRSPYRAVSLPAYRSEWLVPTYFLVSFGMGSVGRLERLLRILAGIACVLAVYAIIQHFTGIDFIKHKDLHPWKNTYKAMGLLGHHITFGVFYAWMLSIALAILLHAARSLRSVVTWTAMSCLAAVAVLYSFSRAAWAGALAAVVTLVVLRRFRLRRSVLVVLAVVVIAVAFEPSIVQRATTSPVGEMSSKADATRVLLLKTSLRMIAAYPVFGIGPGAFTTAFETFKVPGEYRTTCHAHNDLVNFAVHVGLPGFVLIGLVLLAAARMGYDNYARTNAGPGRWLPAALLAGLVAILVSGLFQCNLTDSEIAIQAWLIIGSIALLRRLRNSGLPEASAGTHDARFR